MKLYTLLNAVFRVCTRVFMPDLARQMEAEGTFELKKSPSESLEEANYLRVEDNGAPITIFVFSGLDILYAGMARYEFQRVLTEANVEANLVFLRDCQRTGFFVTPDGRTGGDAFYKEVIAEVMERLGASHNIALGSSIGGSVAIYYGIYCNFQQIISFGAPFEFDVYTRPRRILRSLFDIKKLFTEPSGYAEMLLVSMASIWAVRQILRRAKLTKVPDFMGDYRRMEKRPYISAFYGATAWADVEQAESLREYPEVTLLPIPTGRHNSPAFLKKRGELATVLAREILRHYTPADAVAPE